MLRSAYSTCVLLLFIISSHATVYKNLTRKDKMRLTGQLHEDTPMQRQAAKIIHMLREVIMDMERKIEAHYIIKHKWRLHRRFQIAEIVFDIRKKGGIIRSILKQNLFWDAEKNEYQMRNRTEDYEVKEKDYMSIKDMTRCQYESIEIDKLVHIVEKYQWSRLNSSNIHIKYKYPLRTNIENENENKKSILREQMKHINNNQEGGLDKLVEKLEDIPEENLKELLKKIGDVPQKKNKNIGDMRQEGVDHIKKIVDSNIKASDNPKHPGEDLETDDDEAWK